MPDSGGRIRIATCNIRYDNAEDGDDCWARRRPGMILAIRETGAGIICLQEVLSGQFADLRSDLPEYGFSGVGRDDGKEAGEASPVAWLAADWELLDKGHLWLSETPGVPGSIGWDASCRRMTSWVRLRNRHKSAFRIFAASTHLDHKGNVAREESARLLAGSLPGLANGDPIILGGDFNCPPDSPPYVILSRSLLADTRLASATPPQGPNRTFHGFGLQEPEYIDYLFVSRNLKVDAHRVADIRPLGRSYSDHDAVVADILIP